MKKSKKYKKWKNDTEFIKRQNSLPLEKRIMGNAKPNCYTCIYAGYLFNKEKQCLEPYCTKNTHSGKIYNISITKWNDNFDDRTKNYEDRVIYKNVAAKELSFVNY